MYHLNSYFKYDLLNNVPEFLYFNYQVLKFDFHNVEATKKLFDIDQLN